MDLIKRPDLKSESFQNIFDNSPIGVYIIQDGKFCFVNLKFQDITGFTEQELINSNSLKIVHPDDVEMVRTNAVHMLKGEKRSPYMYRVVSKNGEIKWTIESVTSVRYGDTRAALGYFLDATEGEKAKEALRISEEKFHKAFRSSPEWVVISTLDDGFYIDVNETFLRTTGYNREEVIGRSATELGIWADPNDRAEMVKILRKNRRVRNIECRFRMKSGDIRFVLWSAEVIDYGNETCLLAVTRDITDRKLAEQERIYREKLQVVLEMAGATCHEMNQPLQAIFILLEEIKDENPDNKRILNLKKHCDRLREITRKLNNITNYETKEYVKGSKIIDIDKASK